jgi:hypothetical protein
MTESGMRDSKWWKMSRIEPDGSLTNETSVRHAPGLVAITLTLRLFLCVFLFLFSFSFISIHCVSPKRSACEIVSKTDKINIPSLSRLDHWILVFVGFSADPGGRVIAK